MTPTPWAQAVEAFKTYAPCCECGMCVSDGLRSALLHLLRAVVDKMDAKDIAWPGDTADMVIGLTYRGCVIYVDRASLLSALTAAAGRVDAVTPDSHIGDHA